MKSNNITPKNLSGERIREARKKQGLSQQALAEMMRASGVRISRDTVSRIETKKRLVVDFELKTFAKVLHTDILRLLESA